jgi:hypothetical protein
LNESALQRLVELLRELDPESADWLGELLARHAGDAEGLRRGLNAPRMWGGAGSVASQALKPDTGASAEQVREFRQLMIDLGEELLSGEQPNSDISSWVLAFSNWNQSGI